MRAPKLTKWKHICHYSPTGWAWARANGACSCHVCPPPKDLRQVVPEMRAWSKDLIKVKK